VFAATVIDLFLLVVDCRPLHRLFFSSCLFYRGRSSAVDAGASELTALTGVPSAAELRRSQSVCHASRNGKIGPAVAVVALRKVIPTAHEPFCPRDLAQKEPK
jgi:hypothetical protein